MVATDPASVVWVAATAVHAGFQLIVTGLVYPGLAAAAPDDWAARHHAHSRAITPIVVLVYGILAMAGGWLVTSTSLDAWQVLSLVSVAAAIAITGLVAAPAHGRLSQARTERDLGVLLKADRMRLLAAWLGVVSAVAGVLALG